MNLLEFRVPITASLLVLSLASMFVLTSQSGSSFATYLLAVYTLAGYRRWSGLWFDWVFLVSVGVVLYLATTSFWSEVFDGRSAFSQFSRALLLLCFVVAVAEGFRVDWFRTRMITTVAIFGGAAATAAMILFFAYPPEDGRLNGLGQLDTHVRAALVFGVALICSLSWMIDARSPLSRVLVAVIAVCLAVAVALSGSRNAWVSVPLGCLVYLGARYARSRVQFGVITGALAAMSAGVIAALWFIPESRDFLLPRGDSFRLTIWTEILHRAVEGGLWFGNGVLTDDSVEIGGYVILHPHNMYLSVLYQGGLLGLLGFVALLALSIRTLLIHYDQQEAKLALGIYAVALPAYVLDGFELVDKIGWTWMLVWLPVAISIGLSSGRSLEDAKRFSGG